MSEAAYQDGSWTKTLSRSSLPVRYPLDSGGLSYGWSRSSPIRITRPVNPSDLSVSAALAPASPAPTMTNVRCASTT